MEDNDNITPTPPEQPERYVTEKDLTQLFHYSYWAYRKWRWKGIGPRYHRVNGRILYLPSEVRAWMDSHPTHRSTSEYETPKRNKKQKPEQQEKNTNG